MHEFLTCSSKIMTKYSSLLSETKHRHYDLPKRKWAYYQEWNDAIFLHWKIPLEILRPLVPASMLIDTFEGNAYVSLVAFKMEKIRPRNLPSVNFISDFDEINIRTYIDIDNKKGVYFLNIEAGKRLSVFIAKWVSGLPYEFAKTNRTQNRYKSNHPKKDFRLDMSYTIQESITNKTALDMWLTERYCLYLEDQQNLYRYDIQHLPWELNHISVSNLELDYCFEQVKLNNVADICHYSKGVQVLAWNREKI